MTAHHKSQPQSIPDHMQYFPQLDGMRGIGAFLIMLVHAKGPYYIGGYIWIDMFFVLSSFLITSLLLHEQNKHNNIDLKHFYIKRVLRIAPPLIVILILYGLAATLLLNGPARSTALVDGMYALSNLSNWVKAFRVGDMYYMGHTWSLSLEEQFYLIWPFLLIGLIKVTNNRKQLFFAIVAVAIAGWCYRQYFISEGAIPVRLYMGLDMRVDTLMIGAALAVAYSSPGLRNAMQNTNPRLLAIASIATFILAMHIGFTRSFWPMDNFVWINTIAAIGFTISFWDISLQRGGALKRLYGNTIVVFVGKRSYGVYLWHYPVMQTMHKMGLDWITIWLFGSAITILAAYLSFKYVEAPLMALRKGLPARKPDLNAAIQGS